MKKKKSIIKVIVLLSIIIGIIVFFSIKSVKHSFSNNKEIPKTLVRNKIIDKYIEDNKEFIEIANDYDKKYSIITILSDSKYITKIFDYSTGKELSFNDLLIDYNIYLKKEKELLSLKYPKFIVNELIKDSTTRKYVFKENEIIIYYYDYVINPVINEELYLIINNNEIKDNLKINVSTQSVYTNEDGRVINTNKKLIALTFDDGPGSFTNRLVSILNDNRAGATFFMLGNRLNSFKSAVEHVYNSKLEIGYHSYAHTSFKSQKSATITNELNKSNEILKSIIGEEFHLVRPPYGAVNSDIKSILNIPIILWSIDTEDWRYRDSEYLKNYLLKNAVDGAIVLFHDIHKTSVDAIELALPELYAKGFQVVSVSDLANAYGKTLSNNSVYRSIKK